MEFDNVMIIDISVIIPVYCVEKYIAEFMDSLKSQTIQNFRAIIVNDCSSDNSIQIVAKYKDFFGDRLVLINNKKNMGLSQARNVGIEYVRAHETKYITFLDPDDWMDSYYLEDLYANSEKHNLDLCIGGVNRIEDEGKRIVCKDLVKMPRRVFENICDCKELAIINPCVYSKLFRFEAIKEINMRKIKRSEDTCYLFECLMHYSRVQFTCNALYFYRIRRDSLTGTISEEKYHSMHDVFAEILPIFDENIAIKEMFVTQIFIRSSVGGVCRLSFQDLSRVQLIEKEEYQYLQDKIFRWRENKYLSIFGVKGGVKLFALKMCAQMYKMHCFFLFVYFYYFYNQICGKDIRA